ncbi:hypothetical protein [Vibrio sp. 10N.261.51.F12]|uniref:hypothetical protein n=1 Tax=Vibrio sp. 10N.261.51.F12 TaxID=3229679 RepID=UPI0035537806
MYTNVNNGVPIAKHPCHTSKRMAADSSDSLSVRKPSAKQSATSNKQQAKHSLLLNEREAVFL